MGRRREARLRGVVAWLGRWRCLSGVCQTLVALGEPVVIRGARMAAWPAVTKWTNDSYVAAALGMLEDVSVSSHPVFATADRGPSMADGSVEEARDSHTTRRMSAADLFAALNRTDEYVYHYSKLAAPALLADVQPTDELWLHASDRKHHGMYLWLSGRAVRPALHFDSDHNLFVHVSGVKLFYLFPPWEWHHLQPYPRVHPMWHKSACPLESRRVRQQCPTIGSARALVAELLPGDVLYVPPYWWHQPVSVTPSKSLASWSQASLWADSLKRIYYEHTMVFADPARPRAVRAELLRRHFAGVFGALFKQPLRPMLQVALERRWRVVGPAPACATAADEAEAAPAAAALDERTRVDVDVVVATFRGMMPEANAAGNYKRSVVSLELYDYLERMVARTLGADAVHEWIACS